MRITQRATERVMLDIKLMERVSNGKIRRGTKIHRRSDNKAELESGETYILRYKDMKLENCRNFD